MAWKVNSIRNLRLVAMIMLLLSASAHGAEPAISLPQAGGGYIQLSEPAEHIVTLAPNLAELVFAAGAGHKLKGVVKHSQFPSAVQDIAKVGDAFRIDLERIIEMGPDLVIAWRSGNPQTALQKLEQLGLRVWQIEIEHPHEIAQAVESIALAAGTSPTGKIVAARLRVRLAELEQANTHKPGVDYFYQVAAQPLYTVNGEHIISRSLAICGGRNVFADLASLAPQISKESVIVANPEVMLAPQSNEAESGLDNWLDWPQLRAVKNHSLLYLPADQISQATPRLLDSIELACKLFDRLRQKTHPSEA